MIPYEILLSESQERMLAICRPGRENDFIRICQKWDLDYKKIGKVTDNKNLKVVFNGTIVADIPSYYLSAGDGAPVYQRETRVPQYISKISEFSLKDVPMPSDMSEVFKKVLSSPNIVNRKWVYEQYDYMVRTNTVIEPGGDAAVMRIKGTRKALSMKTDCNARYVYLSPRKGAAIAVAESARNVVCTGALPVAITNCLNFGNPYKPEIYWQFAEAIAGMGEACRVLETPVTGGNVSFYNESDMLQVYPTPVIGMLGIIDDVEHITRATFQKEGDLVFLIGETFEEIGGSEYLKRIHNTVAGNPPNIDLNLEKDTQQLVLQAIRNGFIQSAHDISDGGLAVALAECCIASPTRQFGIKVSVHSDLRNDFLCFSESQSRFIVSVRQNDVKNLKKLFEEKNIPHQMIGEVGGDIFSLNHIFSLSIKDLSDIYFNTLSQLMTT
jgi:phosphoribosylformylglycinamidine synthase II